MAESAPEAVIGHVTITDEISSPPSTRSEVDTAVLFNEMSKSDGTKAAPTSNGVNNESVAVGSVEIDNTTAVAATMVGPPAASFPVTRPSVINRFTNQDSNMIDNGYDSEGGIPYIDDALLDDDFDEEPLSSGPPPPIPAVAAVPEVAAPEPMLTVEQARQLKTVAELKEELKKRGQRVSGNKAELLQRLIEAIERNLPVGSVDENNKRHECMNGLDMTAHWVLLEQNPVPVPPPINADSNLRLTINLVITGLGRVKRQQVKRERTWLPHHQNLLQRRVPASLRRVWILILVH